MRRIHLPMSFKKFTGFHTPILLPLKYRVPFDIQVVIKLYDNLLFNFFISFFNWDISLVFSTNSSIIPIISEFRLSNFEDFVGSMFYLLLFQFLPNILFFYAFLVFIFHSNHLTTNYTYTVFPRWSILRQHNFHDMAVCRFLLNFTFIK